ncbi:hypothetical protein GGI12_001971 [Dipsacomyces acuminosporus]|nr:hypothetical protein GGI12_001971 [Dipsacomyces acuminosporus]
MVAVEDPTAHEIIILSRKYHLSIHYPHSSLYAHVWLGISSDTSDLLVSVTELRRELLDVTPKSESAPSIADSSSGSSGRKDSGCVSPQMLGIRHSDHGLFNCPPDKNPKEWLISKETKIDARSICQAHYAKFRKMIDQVIKLDQPEIPSLDEMLSLLDEFQDRYNAGTGQSVPPTCCICSASPYTRLFFSML